MRQRLAILLACVLAGLGGCAVPALAATHDHRATSSTTTTTTHHRRTTAKHSTTTHEKTRHATRKHTAAASSASTAAATSVLNDCQSHDQLTRDYSRADLKKALAIMSAATQQYSNCSDVIHQALAHGIDLKRGDANGSGGGSSTTTIIIIVVVVLLLLAAIFGGLAFRRRRGGGGGGGGGDRAPAPSGS